MPAPPKKQHHKKQSSRRLPIIWTAVLSHHRTCRSAYGGSVTWVQGIITDKDIVISHLCDAFVCQGFIQYPTLGYTPIAFPGISPFPRFIAGYSKPLQIFEPRFYAFPLLPDIASDFTLNPAIGLLHKFFHICNGIIVQPTCCVLTLFLQHLFQTASLISTG